MKNKRLKSYLKLGMFLFGISLFLYNCQERETIFLDSEQSINQSVNLELINFEDFVHANSKNLESFTRSMERLNQQNSTDRTIENLNISIDSTRVVAINHNNGYSSYTFSVIDGLNEYLVKNLVISYAPDGTEKIKLFEYKTNVTTDAITQETFDEYIIASRVTNLITPNISYTRENNLCVDVIIYTETVVCSYAKDKPIKEHPECFHSDGTPITQVTVSTETFCSSGGGTSGSGNLPPSPDDDGYYPFNPQIPSTGDAGPTDPNSDSGDTTTGSNCVEPLSTSFDDGNGNCVDDITVPLTPKQYLTSLINIIEAPLGIETLNSYKERLSAVGEYLTLASHPDFAGLNEMLTDAINYPGLSINDLGIMWLKTKVAYDILKPYTFELAGLDSLDDMSLIVPPLQLATAERNLTEVAFLPAVKTLLAHWPTSIAQWEALGAILFQPQFLLEIGVAFIPGSSIIDVVSGIDQGDYLAVTFGIAGLIVDAFGGTIVKAIGKIGKVAYKAFKIFKIVLKYLDEVAEIITLGYKADLVDGIVKISNDVGTTIAEIQDNVIRFLTNGAKSIIKVADLKFLDNVLPSPSGNIGKTVIDEKALKIKPDNSDYTDDIADIIQNGDPLGDKTENLIQDLLTQDGYNPPNFDVHLPSNQGFDNVLIKRDSSDNIIDVIINESKQVGTAGNISLSSGVSGCGGCTQMSDSWINYTLDRMRQQGGNLENLADEIDDFNGTITQIVSGVNKNTGELVIINITGF